MLIVSYDISNDKLRTRFAKYLSKFGFRLQYSVFQIKNSKRILETVCSEIENEFGKKFSQTDSVIIFHLSKQCRKYCYGYAVNDDKDVIVVE
ncbi:CRISPR-associated endoribonuclease Cas2 [Sedimentisphaera cyanobacteriorum]|uniref:CRISPR-associated endoribonuclease Cas2 n=1 Tax=Sedimentisphaera cyanobacteriorum TaxID=1940790 RepID=A0A1Q2HT17_9BACT|nr:CRISPR-associated endonuclease Cas2 [Sedimentisphaera cyanobacteriorum]AQQ10484.1 CRISPR-associated endoribonuclease Cas2 [Sedimentisphaera cyanobacteriorum]